jgi:hypothetical protein
MRGADDAAARLALISGTTTPAIRNALPALGSLSGRPARAVTACRRCTAARHIQQPVPVHLPAHHQVCLRHGVWLSGPGAPQFRVSEYPDIIAAERQARRLPRNHHHDGQDDPVKSRNVKRVLVTGMSGAGKSSLLHELAARGYPDRRYRLR